MVHLYTFCDKTLVGKKDNLSAKFLCENLFKLNFKIQEICVYCNNYDYSSISFKNKDQYFLFMQKSNSTLNGVLANLVGCELKENSLIKESVITYYKQINLPLENECSLEWIIPEKAKAITNPNGKTQGYMLKIGEAEIFVLPNEFLEFEKIFNDCLFEYLEKNYVIEYKSETFKTFGLSEQYLYMILKDQIKNKDKVYISIFSRGLDNDIVIKARQDNEKYEEYRRIVYAKLEKFIYTVKDMQMKDYIEQIAMENNVKIAIAGDESLRGVLGNLSSNTIENNVVVAECLPNENAILSFGIQKNCLVTYGEYSTEVVYDIAVKSLMKYESEIVLACFCSFEEKNIGKFIVAIGNKTKVDIYKNQFFGTKEEILANISSTACFYLLKKLESKDYKTI